jgi:hypothetical protein
MSSKSFFEICQEFFDILHPCPYEDEDIELIQDEKKTNDDSDSICNVFINYLTIQFLYISSLFDSKPNDELKYHVY